MYVRNKHHPHMLRRKLHKPWVKGSGAERQQVDQYGALHYWYEKPGEHWEIISRWVWWRAVVAVLWYSLTGNKRNWRWCYQYFFLACGWAPPYFRY